MPRALGLTLVVLCTFTAAANDVQLRATRIDSATPLATWADFNGDGLDDLITSKLELQWNLGGRFAAPVPVASLVPLAQKKGAVRLAAALNSDGFADLLVRNPEAGAPVRLMLGDGFGDFVEHPLPNEHGTIVTAADITNDGVADLVARRAGMITLLRNDGHGAFAVHQQLAWNEPNLFPAIVIGDISGDHLADIVIAEGPYVYFWFGSPNGTFSEARRRFTRTTMGHVNVGDVTADGRADLSFAHTFDDIRTPMVLAGDGTGRFPGAMRFQARSEEELFAYAQRDAESAIIGDFVIGGANEIAYGRRDVVRLFSAANGELREIGSARVDGAVKPWQEEAVNVTVRRASFRRPGGQDLIAEGHAFDVRANPPRRVWLIEATGAIPLAQQNAVRPARTRAVGRTSGNVSGAYDIVLDSACPLPLSELKIQQEGMFVDVEQSEIVRGADAVYVNGSIWMKLTLVERGVTRTVNGMLRPVANGFTGTMFESGSAACGGSVRHKVTLVRSIPR